MLYRVIYLHMNHSIRNKMSALCDFHAKYCIDYILLLHRAF